mmetsp:Transcript_24666/g.43089  ORF Transcript_24666/g.43089 Transcript_24666/m.43089 type:complete len:219 (+) Transcript_24666:1206-1862(+)
MLFTGLLSAGSSTWAALPCFLKACFAKRFAAVLALLSMVAICWLTHPADIFFETTLLSSAAMVELEAAGSKVRPTASDSARLLSYWPSTVSPTGMLRCSAVDAKSTLVSASVLHTSPTLCTSFWSWPSGSAEALLSCGPAPFRLAPLIHLFRLVLASLEVRLEPCCPILRNCFWKPSRILSAGSLLSVGTSLSLFCISATDSSNSSSVILVSVYLSSS